MSKIYYCPFCGTEVFSHTDICPNCKTRITPGISLHDVDYYNEKSLKMVGNYSYRMQILIDEEVCLNPLFQREDLMNNAELEYQKKLNNIFKPEEKNPNIPKCPVCGSTNIKRIATSKKIIGASLFGLFSNTARSQFECSNCKYKF